MITSAAKEKIKRFNLAGLHYNLVADAVYEQRRFIKEPFGEEYQRYITAALISFDMNRMMGQGGENKYDIEAGGFAKKLKDKLALIKPAICHLTDNTLIDIDVENEKAAIISAYKELASDGKNGLNQRGSKFPVGATKILHFINPELFIIIDSNASRAFRSYHGVGYSNTTQPGYTAERYIECLKHAKQDILDFGVQAFLSLEEGTPLARIYDKLTFMTGSDL